VKFRLGPFELSFPPPPSPNASPSAPSPAAPPLESVLSGLAEGILVVDARRRVRLCNSSMERLLNRASHEAVGAPLWEVLRIREVTEMVDRVLEGREEELREVAPPSPAGSVWRVRARPYREGEAVAGAVLTFSDLSALRRLEVVRRDFVANVSHELRTPLTALRAALETLRDGAVDDPTHAREFLETAETHADRLHRLIDDLLALSRLEDVGRAKAAPAAADARAAAEKTAAALRPLADRSGLTLECRLPAGPLLAAASEEELDHILTNLVDNAVKFNRPGGKVWVDVSSREGRVALEVGDTGVGIPKADQPRVFERFYRVDKSRSRDVGGTGLGLSIVKHAAENRGGSVSLRSEPGQGSVFTVLLPPARPA
jgi:two-component system phosphate regulon sensor histidine kinase PhoR